MLLKGFHLFSYYEVIITFFYLQKRLDCFLKMYKSHKKWQLAIFVFIKMSLMLLPSMLHLYGLNNQLNMSPKKTVYNITVATFKAFVKLQEHFELTGSSSYVFCLLIN